MRDFVAFFGEFILVIAVAGMILAIAPEGAQKKYIHFAISLSVLCTLIGPMLSIVSDLPSLLENVEYSVVSEKAELESNLEQEVIAISQKNMENAIKERVSQKFALAMQDIQVEVHLNAEDPGNIEILSVSVYVQNTTQIKREEIRSFLSEMLVDHCRIEVLE